MSGEDARDGGRGPPRWPGGVDLARVIETMTHAMVFDDVDGRVIHANPAFRRMFGVGDDEPLGCTIDYVAPGWSERFEAWRASCIAGAGEPRPYVLLARRRDELQLWVELSAVPIVEDGTCRGTHAVVRDISAQLAREEALRDEKPTLAAALDSIPLAVFVLGADGLVHEWNQGATQMFGWTRGEIVGQPYPLAPDDLAEESRRLQEEILEERRVLEGLETIRRHRDGADIEVAIWAARLQRDDEPEGSVLGVLVDITKQRRAQKDYRQLFERAFEAIVVFEPDSERVLDVNARACELYGFSHDEFVGMSLRSITQDVERGQVVIDRMQRDGIVSNFETVQRRKDGSELLIESNASLVEYQGRPAVLSLNRDLTERRQMQQQLTHMQRMKAVGQLAAGVAHEFNNVLAAILGTAESLLDVAEAPETRERIQQMIARADTGARLTRQLLTFSRGDGEERTPVPVDARIQGMTKWIARMLGQEVELSFETHAPGMVILIDPTQLEQIVLNLSVNARDAMLEGGSLRIRTEARRLERPLRTLTGILEPGLYVSLEFRDTGSGVPPEVRDRLFEPFFSTKERGKGTGLGLATVYTIVDGLGGAIDLKSDGGACFTVILPALEYEPADRKPARQERPAGGTETILLVDDEPTILRALGHILRSVGYRVLSASNAVAAQRVFDRAGGAVDLLLTDVSMPGGSGVSLAQSLLERSPRLRVLLMSGYLDEETASRLPRAGFVDKPFTRRVICRKVRDVLDEDPTADLG